jgi:hypothetical protein
MNVDLTALKREQELGEALLRLRDNPDFKLLIETEYLKEFPAQLAMLAGADDMQYPDGQARIKKSLDGVGALSNFFNRVRIQGESAKNNIASYEAGDFADFDDVE